MYLVRHIHACLVHALGDYRLPVVAGDQKSSGSPKEQTQTAILYGNYRKFFAQTAKDYTLLSGRGSLFAPVYLLPFFLKYPGHGWVRLDSRSHPNIIPTVKPIPRSALDPQHTLRSLHDFSTRPPHHEKIVTTLASEKQKTRQAM